MSSLSASPSHLPEIERLIALWLEQGALQPENLERGRSAALGSGERLDRVLSKLGLVSDDHFATGWGRILGMGVAELLPEQPFDLPGVPIRFLSKAGIYPIRPDGEAVVVAVSDPLDGFSLQAIAAKSGLTIIPEIARPSELLNAIERMTTIEAALSDGASGSGLASDVDRLRDLASDAPAIRAIEAMIGRAVDAGASDIHVLPSATGGRVRVRVDGVLRDQSSWPKDLTLAVISRLKVMAGLDIAESRLPQDGRLRAPYRGVEIDFRMATIPHIHGEGVVLRVLHRARATPDLRSLQLPAEVLSGLEKVVASPNGLLLVTGPTGSGKTTTLYATLQKLARPDRNIITVEDPVEHAIEGTAQVQVDRKIGFDFAQALRSILRHDPDVVMIGEIRDAETASIAVRAALTGHLVLATVHTNSALDAVPRLMDMGIEPWLLASTFRGSMAQRLLRRLCPGCKRPSSEGLERFRAICQSQNKQFNCESLFEAVGCLDCAGTGYRGRVAVGEFVPSCSALTNAISAGASGDALATVAPQYTPLFQDGLARASSGEVSFDELERVLGENFSS